MQNANMYEDYLHLHPARGQTLSEITGVEPQGNAPLLVTEIYGKRMGDEGYLEVQKRGFLERVDAISRSKVPELIEEKAQEDARIDIQQYFTGEYVAACSINGRFDTASRRTPLCEELCPMLLRYEL